MEPRGPRGREREKKRAQVTFFPRASGVKTRGGARFIFSDKISFHDIYQYIL